MLLINFNFADLKKKINGGSFPENDHR